MNGNSVKSWRLIVAGILATATAPPAVAATEESAGNPGLREMWQRVGEELEAASLELLPPLEPPTPTKVKWRATRIGSIDLGAPLLAIAVADVDLAGKAEVVALTTDRLMLIRASGRKLTILASAELVGGPAEIAPRDPVGSLVVIEGGEGRVELFARSSTLGRGGSYRWVDGKLEPVAELPGFPLGDRLFAELEPGRNYFTAANISYPPEVTPATTTPEQFYAAHSSSRMVDRLGRPLRGHGFVSTAGQLQLHFERRCRRDDSECQQNRTFERSVDRVGVAFAIGDVDTDGIPEVIVSANQPPGDADRVTVYTPHEGRNDRLHSHKFSGGVAGLGFGDLDGNGAGEVIAAVRLVGSTRIDLWRLN